MSNDDETYDVILLKIQETFSEHEKSSLALRETRWTIDRNSCLLPHVGCRVTPAKVRGFPSPFSNTWMRAHMCMRLTTLEWSF